MNLREVLQAGPDNQQLLVEQAMKAAAEVMPDKRELLLSQTVDAAVEILRRDRDSLPDSAHEDASGDFTQLDSVLIPLLQVQRAVDMDVLGPYPASSDAFDLLISDVKPEDLPNRISQALGKPYLADMEVKPGPVKGIVFNTKDSKLRVLVTLPVSARDRSVATHFIFDTGAPCTYVALSVLEALGLQEWSLGTEVVKVNGVKSNLSVSDTSTVSYESNGRTEQRPCHFVGLNILGMDYLDRAGIKLVIDMEDNSVLFHSPRFE